MYLISRENTASDMLFPLQSNHIRRLSEKLKLPLLLDRQKDLNNRGKSSNRASLYSA